MQPIVKFCVNSINIRNYALDNKTRGVLVGTAHQNTPPLPPSCVTTINIINRKENLMKLWMTIIICALVFSSIACNVSVGDMDFNLSRIEGSGILASEERPVSDFRKVQFSGIGSLYIEHGEVETLTVEADDNLLEYIEVEVRNEVLYIGLRKGVNINPKEKISFRLTINELDEIGVSGAGNVIAPDLEAKRFDIDVSGAGNIEINQLISSELHVKLSGVGNIAIKSGQVINQEISISGTGSYNAINLEADVVIVDLSGLGSASVWAEEELTANISGAGKVEYAGQPRVNSNISGVGKLERSE